MPSNFTVAGNDTDNIFLLRGEAVDGPNPFWGLWTSGRNTNGQLGQGDIVHRSSPVQVGSLNWASVSATSRHTLAIAPEGTLWAWGCLLYTSPSPRDRQKSRMPSSA